MARAKPNTQPPGPPTTSQTGDQCSHVFVGGADGVQCTACGLKLTTEEFRELLKADN